MAWIAEAIRFGYWLVDETLRRKQADRLFALVSCPTLSCLAGFVVLGCVLRNRLSVSSEEGEEQRRIQNFLRIWEAGQYSKLSGPNNKRYQIMKLCSKHDGENSLEPGHFRSNPDQIHAITQYRIWVNRPTVRHSLRWEVTTANCLNYSLGTTQTAYERILEDLGRAAALPGSNATYLRIPVFLAGPRKKNLTTLYGEAIHIDRDGVGSSLSLKELMNLDTSGRNIDPRDWNGGSWLNPKARRQNVYPGVIAKRGVAVIDGATAWERWSEILQMCTRVLILHRASSNLRYERMCTILNQSYPSLGSPVVADGHPWFKEFNPIRAFVHIWD